MPIRPTPTPDRAPDRPSFVRRLAALLATVLAAASVLAVAPAPAAAAPRPAAIAAPAPQGATATPDDMAAMLLSWMNQDRVDRGLLGYRAWPDLAALATERAGRMAAAHDLSHATAGGNVGDALDAAKVPWQGYGEIIGMSSYPWGQESAANIYGMWMNSPAHHAIMMSDAYNYVGIGVVQAEDGTTWMSEVMTQSPDHTAPLARNRSVGVRNGDDVTFSWAGSDPRLQTNTAGIRSYDVQVRRDSGSWSLARNDTASTSLVLLNRWHRHWYGFRVQAKDRRGNLSRWTSEIRVWVP